jgi:hypothetical protein
VAAHRGVKIQCFQWAPFGMLLAKDEAKELRPVCRVSTNGVGMIQFGAMAAIGGLSALSNLVSSTVDAAKSGKSSAASLFAPSGEGAKAGAAVPPTTSARSASTFSPSTMASIIEMQSQQSDPASASSGANSAKSLFSQLDSDGDGKISKNELEQAFAGSENDKIKQKAKSLADALLNKLDTDGDGKVSETEMKAAQKSAHDRHRQPPVNAQMATAIQAMTAANAASTASVASTAVASA